MRKIIAVAAVLAFAPLAACSESPEEAQEEVAQQQLESSEDVIEEQADLAEAMGDEATEETLDEQADAMGEAADEVDGANVIAEPAAQEAM